MQRIEMSDYVNEGPGRKDNFSGVTQKSVSERKLCHLVFLIVGVICVLQATLNISLRLAFYSSMKPTSSDCNVTQDAGKSTKVPVAPRHCEDGRDCQCNELQERFNALTADKNLLENRNNILNNRIKTLEEDKERLRMMIRDMGGHQPCQKCPPGWMEINSRCYFLSTEEKSWEDSRTYCQTKMADLVVINSEQEQRAIYRPDGDQYLLFWIGLHRTDGPFRWVDGSPLTLSFWMPGQPDDGGPNNIENCVEMYHSPQVLATWNDANCQKRRRWMCEKEQCPV